MGIQPRRHQYLVEPGAGVFTTASLMDLADRTKEFLDDTGLPAESVVVSPVVQLPIPVIDPAGSRVQAEPDMMWFPMFWLPPQVGARRMMPGDDGDDSDRPETVTEWTVRVMSMCAASGLFDPVSGTWLDALSTVGLDADSEEVQARVISWQAGGADPDLDRIDFTDLLVEGQAEAAAEAVLPLIPELLGAQYALTAEEISESVTAVLDDESLDAEALTGAATLYLVLATQGFVEDPDAEGIPKVLTAVRGLLERLQAEVAEKGEAAADATTYLKDLRAICEQVRLTFSPFLDLISEMASEMEEPEKAAVSEPEPEPTLVTAPVGWGEGAPAAAPESVEQVPKITGW